MISGLPQQGQPLDLQYISELAKSIIDLNAAVSSKSYSKTLVKNFDGILKNDRTSNSSFYAVFDPVVTNETIAPGTTKKFTHNFTSSFTTAPVVTVTPFSSGKTFTGHDLSVVITEITPGSVSGVVKFNNTTAGEATVGINIIAIGFQGSAS
jgi:hypothetical protein